MLLDHGGPTRTTYIFGSPKDLRAIMATLEARLKDAGSTAATVEAHVRSSERFGHGPIADLYTRTARIGTHNGRHCIRVRACTTARYRVIVSIRNIATDLGIALEVAA